MRVRNYQVETHGESGSEVIAYEEIEKEIREAIEFHIAGMRNDGEVVPQPSSSVEYMEVAV